MAIAVQKTRAREAKVHRKRGVRVGTAGIDPVIQGTRARDRVSELNYSRYGTKLLPNLLKSDVPSIKVAVPIKGAGHRYKHTRMVSLAKDAFFLHPLLQT